MSEITASSIGLRNMEYDYFEERFIEEHFQEEIIGRNTSRIDYN